MMQPNYEAKKLPRSTKKQQKAILKSVLGMKIIKKSIELLCSLKAPNMFLKAFVGWFSPVVRTQFCKRKITMALMVLMCVQWFELSHNFRIYNHRISLQPVFFYLFFRGKKCHNHYLSSYNFCVLVEVIKKVSQFDDYLDDLLNAIVVDTKPVHNYHHYDKLYVKMIITSQFDSEISNASVYLQQYPVNTITSNLVFIREIVYEILKVVIISGNAFLQF
ncbi:CLUMA_CG020456, isoform A [Clunio marinus]|uniref:CLUMA_CG020456, isoform A n=1 Tax=Clunio marinus TaxID=568069 RepID=A0A1J1J512_9DIPT|nr:CLUMA_CG020456, isoform A [Clunio marinus]